MSNLGGVQKHIKLVVILLVILGGLGLSIFAGSRVSNLFLNTARASACPAQNIRSAQVSSNGAVVSWDTTDNSIGKVVYGTESKNLAFSSLEGSQDKKHNVPLTLLTPNTKYHFMIVINKKACDSSGQVCATEKGKDFDGIETCVPWNFTTTTVTPQGEIVAPIVTVTPFLSPTSAVIASPSAVISKSATPSGSLVPSVTGGVVPTSGLSAFCQELTKNIGANSGDTTAKWEAAKQYDLDNNGFVNGMDIVKCPSSGK